MSNLSIVFIIIYVLSVIIFLLIPKKSFNALIKSDFDKNFNSDKIKDVGYYRVVILGGGITALFIIFIIKPIFY